MRKKLTQEQLLNSLGKVGSVLLIAFVFIFAFFMMVTALAGYILVKLVK